MAHGVRLSRLLSTVAFAALVVAMGGCASAPKPAAVAAAKPAANDKEGKDAKPYKEWSEVTKDAEKLDGFFTLYRKRDSLYLELEPGDLGKPVLGIFSLARGIGMNFLLGGLPLNDRLLEFQRSGDRILMIERNTRFVAPAESAYDRARDLSYGQSVVAALKIESLDEKRQAVLVDLAPVLVSDFTDMSQWMREALDDKPVSFDKERSAISSVKVFPENAEIEALLTFTPGDRKDLDLHSVPDQRYVPITVHYSFLELPETPMAPRLADERVGYFLNPVKDFSRDLADDYWRRYINRWRLEKKDPAATVSEPVQPIVFYLDRTIPEAYRPYIKQGVEAWQRAFEEAGFKNAIVAKDAPDDPDWDPEDARYSTIRWIVSSEPSFGAIGPSRVDPRTGEILDADILFEGSIVQRSRNAWRRYVAPQALAAEVIPAPPAALSFVPLERRCAAAGGMADGAALLNLGLLVQGDLAGGEVPEAYLGPFLIEVTMHEVGHTLGLRHNFRSSASTPHDRLQDPEWTRQHGVTASVMDYSTPNIAGNGGPQGEYYSTGVGDYDRWAIRYGYTPTGAPDLDADYAAVAAIAAESTQPGHAFATDEDTYPRDAMDPDVRLFDLGDDPLRFAQERSAYIAALWRSGRLEERVVGADGQYPRLRYAMDTLLSQYGRALGLAVRYVGGQRLPRVRRGQDGAGLPLQPVDAERQRAALDFLGRAAFDVPPELLNRLAPERWLHWGTPNPFDDDEAIRLDYDLNDRVLAIQTAVLDGLLSPRLLARLSEAESHGPKAFTLAEMMDGLSAMVWSEVRKGGGELKALEGPGTRRDLQRAHLDRLAAMVVAPAPDLPGDARALARLQLERLDAQLDRALARNGLGDYTRSHLLESRARIARALAAERQVEG
jgi:uncharacterized protein DUF4953/uncharacterized protein DUF5117